jgi:hypothetical protein
MLNGRCRMHGGLSAGATASALGKAGIISVDLVPLEGSQRALIGALDWEKGGVVMTGHGRLQRALGPRLRGASGGQVCPAPEVVDHV